MQQIGKATMADIEALKELMNSAYRGDASRKGWTTEADLIAGEVRTDERQLRDVLQKPGSVMLVYRNETGEITGCVNLQQQGRKLYLGMFSVDPEQQGQGIGKKLLQAADEHAKSLGCTSIYMTVISVRNELIAWYKRHGYRDNGERKPFIEDGLTGKHLRPLEFMVLEKELD